jgi:hypothetical protein
MRSPRPSEPPPYAPQVYGWIVARDRAAHILHRWIVATVISSLCAGVLAAVLIAILVHWLV